MPRSIRDEEISLIKRMLQRGMRNNQIQFYFNRQDRPVNSGRITGIRNASYGPEVAIATNEALDVFLEEFVPIEVGVAHAADVAREPTSADIATSAFELREDDTWFLREGETSEQECKATFDPARLDGIVRAIAALSNNRGGFIYFGVTDNDFEVTGLQDDLFQTTDIARITDRCKTLLAPTPVFLKDVINLGGATVGFIHVEKHSRKPIVVTRDGDRIHDGSIYFRYPGQSAQIKSADLFELLRDRDRSAQEMLLSSASKISSIGTDKAIIFDTNLGTLDAGDKQLQISSALASQLEFIREGHFDETEGAATLRLVGDVHEVDEAGQVVERLVGQAITPDMAVSTFLRRAAVENPLQYIAASSLYQRQWLPIFFFARQAGQRNEEVADYLDSQQHTYRVSKTNALQRLHGLRSAYSPITGNRQDMLEALMAENLDGIEEVYYGIDLARCLHSLPDDFVPSDDHFELLQSLHKRSQPDQTLKGYVFKAAARLDELLFESDNEA